MKEKTIFFAIIFCLAKLEYCQPKTFFSPLKATVNVNLFQDDFYADIQCTEKPLPGGIPQKTQNNNSKLSKKNPSINQSQNLTAPFLGNNFFGNAFYNSTPNDNDIAVSDSCKIISVSNTLIYFYDCENDSSLGSKSLSVFSAPLGLLHEEFDPIVEYDPTTDKFVLVCLNGFTDSTSNIIIGFSQTNDPKGTWNLYTIPGNPKNNGLWTDYPMMSITQKEIFLTVNLLRPDSSWQTGFVETLVWQINKTNGYSGTLLNMQMHDSIFWNGKAIRNLCPVKGGSYPKGPNNYFISNRNFGVEQDTVFLIEITDTINSSGQQLLVKQLNSDKQYSFPPDARQVGIHKFATNDCRNLGAFLENDKIQYVHNTLDSTTGFCATYHGIINNVSSLSPIINGNIINDTLLDLGYPNISYAGISVTDNTAIINFNHSAPTVNAGCSVIKTNGAGQYSNILAVKNGSSYVNVLSSPIERWGDYSGTQRKYNDPDKIWMNGYYGYLQSSQRKHGTWIGLITSAANGWGVGVGENKKEQEINLFPNPTMEIVTIKFDLDKNEYLNFVLYDLSGKAVKVLMREYVKAGNQSFVFSLAPMPAGDYFIKIYNNFGSVFVSKKIIKS